MSLGCVIENNSGDTPDIIYDESSITLTIDNQGLAILQMIILKKSDIPFSLVNFSYPFDTTEFVGFLHTSSPEKLTGTEYFEHKISVNGITRAKTSGGGQIG